jgi:hypothetical protein
VSESRGERLSRIRAFTKIRRTHIAAKRSTISYIVCAVGDPETGMPINLTWDDLTWLLVQAEKLDALVAGDLEYRVEGWTQIDGRGPFVWSPWHGPYADLSNAQQMLESYRNGGMRFRITCRPAPSEEWTPVEEEHP